MKEMPPKPQERKLAPETKIPFAISSETAEATLTLTQAMEQRGKVSEDEAKKFVSAFKKDVKANGIPMTKEEEARWEEDVIENLKNAKKPDVSEASKPPEEDFNLGEYVQTVGYINKLYDVQKYTGPLGLLESVLVANKVAGLSTVTGLFTTVKHAIGKWGDITQLSDEIRAGVVNTGGKVKLSEDQKSKIWGLVGKSGWPLYAPILAKIPLVAGDYFVKRHFVSQMEGVRGAINKRIAESVFMRDYEFVHDKSAAEIMDKVQRGKESTITLLEKTYLNMIPALAEVGGSIIPQVSTNWLGAALAAVRVGAGYFNGIAMTKDILTKRKEILNRQNAIDTRIMTSLSSLETVKTSDSMQEAIIDLEQSMKARDQVAKDMAYKQVKKGLQQQVADFALTNGIPLVTAGFDMFKGVGGIQNYKDLWDIFHLNFDRFDGMEWDEVKPKFQGIGWGILNFAQSSLSQSAMEEGINRSAAIYANDIKPALQDIKRMEALLGPYDQVDRPSGPKEKARVPASTLKSFDISVTNLSFKNILHKVNMDIPQGSFVTIKGPSGIGKTTFFRHLVGLYGAEDGSVTYGGIDLQGIKKFGTESIYSNIAYANQNPQYFEDLNLRDNLLLWTKQKVPDAKIRTVLHDLRLDHILDRIDSRVKHFSGGELRRIGIARALLKDPKVLFLDEPTANLDAASAKQVLEIIKDMRVKRPDMTVVAVTHDENFEKIAEQIVDFQKVNKPTNHDGAPLGTRQVFYAKADSRAVN